jgi:hypothetical protein
MKELEAISQMCKLADELRRTIEYREALPRTPEDVTALLVALADAEHDAKAHFDRFPRIAGQDGPYASEDPVACEKDWLRVCRRRDIALRAILVYANALTAVEKDKAA